LCILIKLAVDKVIDWKFFRKEGTKIPKIVDQGGLRKDSSLKTIRKECIEMVKVHNTSKCFQMDSVLLLVAQKTNSELAPKYPTLVGFWFVFITDSKDSSSLKSPLKTKDEIKPSSDAEISCKGSVG